MDNHTYNELLKWSILNTDPSSKDAPVTPQPRSEEDFAALRYAFSHIKSESALMLDYFTVIENAQAPAEEKYKAFEALRVCLGQVDNANNMDNIVPPDEKTDEEKKMEKNQEENVKSNVEQDVKSNEKKKGLWVRLIKQLDNQDPEIRMLAASCCQTAVENNRRSQERLLQLNAIPTLVRLATSDSYKGARKKATTALSSTVRNFQPGLDAVLGHMPAEYKPDHALDAADMESVDILINKLRESI